MVFSYKLGDSTVHRNPFCDAWSIAHVVYASYSKVDSFELYILRVFFAIFKWICLHALKCDKMKGISVLV